MPVRGPVTAILSFAWQATWMWRMPKMEEQFSAKRKYPKKRPPHAALILRAAGFERGFSKGRPAPAKNAMHPCIAPVGPIRSNPPVLGAA